MSPKKVVRHGTNAIIRLYFARRDPKKEPRLCLERRPFEYSLDLFSLSLSVRERLLLLSVVLWFTSK